LRAAALLQASRRHLFVGKRGDGDGGGLVAFFSPRAASTLHHGRWLLNDWPVQHAAWCFGGGDGGVVVFIVLLLLNDNGDDGQ